jgi:hypothetical protein
MEGHQRQRQRRRRVALGLGRLADRRRASVQDRQMIIGPSDGSGGKKPASASIPNTSIAAKARPSGRHTRLSQRGDDWIGLGEQRRAVPVAEGDVDGGRAAYFDVPFYMNQASGPCRDSKLLLEAGYTPFRYNPIFGHSAARTASPT